MCRSAALYCVALISLRATYVVGSNGQYVYLDTPQPIIVNTPCHHLPHATHWRRRLQARITFTLIIDIIGLGLGETTSEQHSASFKTGHRVLVDAVGGHAAPSVAPRDWSGSAVRVAAARCQRLGVDVESVRLGELRYV